MANAFYAETKKDILVTDGYRTPVDQAQRMFADAQEHIITSRYRQYNAAKEIQDAYDQAKEQNLDRSNILNAMATVIARQVSNGTFVSDHLRNNAADIRSKGMSPSEREAFREIASGLAQKLLLEFSGNIRREHWHLEF